MVSMPRDYDPSDATPELGFPGIDTNSIAFLGEVPDGYGYIDIPYNDPPRLPSWSSRCRRPIIREPDVSFSVVAAGSQPLSYR